MIGVISLLHSKWPSRDFERNRWFHQLHYRQGTDREKNFLLMRRRPFAFVFFVFLFSPFCFGQQPATGSTAGTRGLRGAVQSVSTENFICNADGKEIPAHSDRSVYDRTGYETQFDEYDSLHRLRSHSEYTWNGSRLLKAEITNPFSKQKSVQLYNSEGVVTETDSYDGNGVLSARIVNDSALQKEKPVVSTKRATDGSISTIERSADGSFKESTVKPDGTVVIHAHYRASPQPPLFLPVGDNVYDDWYQTSDANNRPLEFIEEPPTGEYRRFSSRYDKSGREIESATYDRFGKLLAETTFQYLQEDENGNWTEQEIWARTESNPARLHQVTYRTITYYGNPLDDKR